MLAAIVHNNEFWIAIAFAIIVIIGWRPARARLNASLDDRSALIKAEIDEAERLRDEAMRMLAECERKQRDALAQAEQIVALARAEAERAAEQAKQDLVATLERRRRIALERIALEEQKAALEVRNLAVDVAVAAAGRILSESLDGGRRSELIEQTVKSLPNRLH